MTNKPTTLDNLRLVNDLTVMDNLKNFNLDFI